MHAHIVHARARARTNTHVQAAAARRHVTRTRVCALAAHAPVTRHRSRTRTCARARTRGDRARACPDDAPRTRARARSTHGARALACTASRVCPAAPCDLPPQGPRGACPPSVPPWCPPRPALPPRPPPRFVPSALSSSQAGFASNPLLGRLLTVTPLGTSCVTGGRPDHLSTPTARAPHGGGPKGWRDGHVPRGTRGRGGTWLEAARRAWRSFCTKYLGVTLLKDPGGAARWLPQREGGDGRKPPTLLTCRFEGMWPIVLRVVSLPWCQRQRQHQRCLRLLRAGLMFSAAAVTAC